LLEELGYYGLIDTAYHECTTAQQKHPFSTQKPFSHIYKWKHIGTPILADIPFALLQALVELYREKFVIPYLNTQTWALTLMIGISKHTKKTTASRSAIG
jgi:hypothetical protein